MKIGIDCRFYDETGVGRYIRNLLFQISKIDQKNEYLIFLRSQDFNKVNLPKNFNKIKLDIPWYTLKEQFNLPKVLLSYKLDLVHLPHFNVPIFYPKKYIVTIHDLIHQHFKMQRVSTHGKFVHMFKQIGYKYVLSQALKSAQKIITVSNYVKGELMDKWLVDERKIEVTYEAVEKGIVDLSKKITQTKINQVLDKFGIRPPFIFYVGNAHPHKNVEGLIKAFLNLRNKYQYLTLVLSGKDHYFWRLIKDKYQDKGILYTGFLTDLELVSLYKSAQVYVMPSFEEGFGIPALEAMACGCAVAASNRASLPEICSYAALYFDPSDSLDMSAKIMKVLNDKIFRADLVEKGYKRYKEFSWEKLARETLEIYQNI